MSFAIIPLSVFANPETVVTNLTITEPIGPINGKKPITTFETEQYSATLEWRNSSDTLLNEDDTFSAGNTFKATITLTPKTGYTFTGVAENAFTIPSAKTVTNVADSGVITADFKAPPNRYITDGHGYAAYRIFGERFDVYNHDKGDWSGTTYDDDRL